MLFCREIKVSKNFTTSCKGVLSTWRYNTGHPRSLLYQAMQVL